MRVKRGFVMKSHFQLVLGVAAAVLFVGLSGQVAAEEQSSSAKSPEQAGEEVWVEGTYVRVAANNEGWVVVGYRIANESVGQEYMVIEVGMTVMKDSVSQEITRNDIKLVTPDHKVISLPTQEEYEKVHGKVLPLVKRDATAGDRINYFPSHGMTSCSLEFFTEPGAPRVRLAYDKVLLSSNTACTGRLFFDVPGGIQHGLYNFDVKFANSIVKVPIQIMTEDEAKQFTKEWKKQLKESRHKGHEH